MKIDGECLIKLIRSIFLNTLLDNKPKGLLNDSDDIDASDNIDRDLDTDH